MKNLQFYRYAALALLLLNIGIIAFFIITMPRPPHGGERPGFSDRAADVLKLDKQQHDTFLDLAKEHSELMRGFNDQQRDLLKPYFQTLAESSSKIDADSLLQRHQEIERKKIESTYKHFQDVKSILKDDQQESFGVFMESALRQILMEGNKKPPRGKF